MTNTNLICGVDEAGRGPWAGPVTAAAVILDPNAPIEGLTDSKKLTERKRDRLAPLIQQRAIAWSVVHVSAQDIDTLNIRQATHLAMRRAIEQLSTPPSHALIDGNDCPAGLLCDATTIIKGDLTEPAISAASILAKTARDALLRDYDAHHPAYGFAKHKGYGTAAHAAALNAHGPCPLHRMSFAPVKRAAERHATR
jgi:ribonuclease HII